MVFFETGSLTEPAAHRLSYVGYPVSTRDPPVSISLNLGPHAYIPSTLLTKSPHFPLPFEEFNI